MHGTEEASNDGSVRVRIIHALNISHKELHDHARQYDNDDVCHDEWNGGKLYGNISQNGYGNAIIGRYGGCFD